MTAQFSPVPSTPTLRAYAAWIRTSSTDLALYPGYKGPGPTTLDRGPRRGAPGRAPRLLATFNSGFYESDAAAGFYTNTSTTIHGPGPGHRGRVVRRRGRHRDWQGGPAPGTGVVMARQNLAMLVERGRPDRPTANIGR